MEDQMELKQAKDMYNTLIEAMSIQKWKYEEHPDELTIAFTVHGDDIPMQFIVSIDARRKLIRLASLLPFKMKEEKRLEGAIITSAANYLLADGSFDYDMTDGEIVYRMTSSYRESLISTDVFLYMINYASQAVDEFNDKFLLVNLGNMTVEEFISKSGK